MSIPKSAPPWVREGRQPTRKELANKHEADGGGMAPPPTDPATAAFFKGDDEGAPAPVRVRRYNS